MRQENKTKKKKGIWGEGRGKMGGCRRRFLRGRARTFRMNE